MLRRGRRSHLHKDGRALKLASQLLHAPRQGILAAQAAHLLNVLLGEVVLWLAALVAHLRGQVGLCRYAAAVIGGGVAAAVAAEAQDGLAAGVVAREEDEGRVLGRGL